MSGKEIIKTALRVPVALHGRIHEEARRSGRTFNAEIVFGMAERYGVSLGEEKENAPEGESSEALDQ